MPLEIKKAEYFNITAGNNAEETYKLLSRFSEVGIGLLAFKATPLPEGKSLFSLFPDDSSKMKEKANEAGIEVHGPHTAIIVKSDSDEPGECADIFRRISDISIKAFESVGIADIKDSYGVVLYLQPEDCEKALAALMVST